MSITATAHAAYLVLCPRNSGVQYCVPGTLVSCLFSIVSPELELTVSPELTELLGS
jgi:hypothetical protein